MPAGALALLLADLALLAWPGLLPDAARLLAAAAGGALAVALAVSLARAHVKQSPPRPLPLAPAAAPPSQLERLVDALPAAVAVFDADDRLVVANPAYRAANAELADILHPGLSFEALARVRAQRGLVPAAVGREEDWVQQRLAAHRNPGPALVVSRPGGVWWRIVERRIDGGGVLLHSVDITDAVDKEQALEGARRDAELAHERLVDAIEALPATFELYDADDRLVMHNHALALAYPHLTPHLAEGLRFAELARLDAAHGGQAELLGDLDEWLARREAQRRAPQAGRSTLIGTPDGRWMRMYETRLRSGGMVAIRVDATEIEAQRVELDEARRLAEMAMSRLEDAIEALPAGFELFDAADRLVISNRRLREMYPGVGELLAGYPTFEEMVRASHAKGHLDVLAPGETLDAWLAERQRERKNPGAPREQQMAPGVWVRIYERRLRDGGLVGVRVDVSEQKLREQQLTQLNERLDRANAELSRLSDTDALTGLANRRLFDRRLEEEGSRAVRHRMPLALVMFDVDHFKRYNDHHGHPAGDACLRAVAGVLRAEVRRAGDVVARLGGEEFAILLPHHDEAEALALAERCLAGLERAAVVHGDSPLGPHVTLSGGVAELATVGVAQGPAALVAAADAALYAAKQAGRQRVMRRGGSAPVER